MLSVIFVYCFCYVEGSDIKFFLDQCRLEPVPALEEQGMLVPKVYGTGPGRKFQKMFGTSGYMEPGFGRLDK